MGSGIAAHMANLGFSVTLLDLTEDSVRGAFDRAKRARPPHFYVPETAESVRLGSIGRNLEWAGEADWVCEAIVEKLDAKRQLFQMLEPLLREDAFVSTNTSGLEISILSEGRSDSFRRRFLGTHFFNPPRYLKLLELIPTPETDASVVRAMTGFLEEGAARRVVVAKDTPGFIANRFGMWSMFHATHVAERLGLTIEQVDLITGPFLGRPRSGSFRLNDLVGIDIMEDIARNLVSRCPDDPHTKELEPPRSLAFLLEKGWIGEKAGQGYYRREGRELMSLDLVTLAYRMRLEPDLPSVAALAKKPLPERLREGLQLRDEVGEFLREYLPSTLAYADWLKKDISHSVEDFDRVMMWGFGWEAGPFAMRDMVGASEQQHFVGSTQLGFDDQYVPRAVEPQYATIGDFRLIESREGFNLRDLGDGVTAVATTTKMGVFGVDLIRSLAAFLAEGAPGPIVLTSEGRTFSAGFDLKFLLQCTEEGRLHDVETALYEFQSLGQALGRVPSVAAVFGHCLGGGFEMAASCGLIAAAPETQIGLPESRVGLIPGGGGAALMRVRHQQTARSLSDMAKVLVLGTVATNAEEARKIGYLRREDVTVFHPDRVLTEAKRLALTVGPRQEPAWAETAGPVAGMIDQAVKDLIKAGEATDHDAFIGEQIKQVFAKAHSFEAALGRERAAFEALLKEGLTVARIRHMLDTGKPLRN
jgi:3-hydroxyacyl-CoA dehydrogenase